MSDCAFKPGDRVFVESFGMGAGVEIAEIAKVGKIHILLKDRDTKFRLDGFAIGVGWDRSRLVPISDQSCRDRYARQRLDVVIRNLLGKVGRASEGRAIAVMEHVKSAIKILEAE